MGFWSTNSLLLLLTLTELSNFFLTAIINIFTSPSGGGLSGRKLRETTEKCTGKREDGKWDRQGGWRQDDYPLPSPGSGRG